MFWFFNFAYKPSVLQSSIRKNNVYCVFDNYSDYYSDNYNDFSIRSFGECIYFFPIIFGSVRMKINCMNLNIKKRVSKNEPRKK